ncbi:MAG: sulfotransferase, partial [Pseudomonadota bacterium]
MPDFICIGGQRTGTTWLHHVLSSNQTVWMPPCKELHHFDTLSPDVTAYPYRYREHLGSRLRHYGLAAARLVRRDLRPDVAVRLDWDWDLRYFLQPGRSIDWYRRLFQTRAAQGKVTGEITPAYSLLPQGEVQAIADALPKAKIILILREPLSRAWSHALKDLPAEAANDTDRMV